MEKRSNEGPLFKYVPFDKNSSIHLVFFIASCYILLHIVSIVFLILNENDYKIFNNLILPNVAIKDGDSFIQKPWTILTYALGHKSFIVMATNLLWMYIFGNLIQSIISYKEIITFFFVNTILSSLIYIAIISQMDHYEHPYILNALPGVVGMAFGAFTLSPNYRFQIANGIYVNIKLLLLVFAILTGLFVGMDNALAGVLYIISAILGAVYMLFVKKGIMLGGFLYDLYQSFTKMFGPKEVNNSNAYTWKIDQLAIALKNHPSQLSESEIDRLLLKIKNNGIESLTISEKELIFGLK